MENENEREKNTNNSNSTMYAYSAHTRRDAEMKNDRKTSIFIWSFYFEQRAVRRTWRIKRGENIGFFFLIYDVMPSALRTSSYEIQTEKSWGTKLFTGQICGERDDNRKAENIPI